MCLWYSCQPVSSFFQLLQVISHRLFFLYKSSHLSKGLLPSLITISETGKIGRSIDRKRVVDRLITSASESAAVSVSGIGSEDAPSRDNAIFGDRGDRMLTARSGPFGLGVPRTLGPAEGSDHLFLLPERALIMDSTHLRQDLAGLDFNLHLNLLRTAPRGNVWLCESRYFVLGHCLGMVERARAIDSFYILWKPEGQRFRFHGTGLWCSFSCLFRWFDGVATNTRSWLKCRQIAGFVWCV